MKNYVFAIWCICLITALSCSKEQQAPTVNRVELDSLNYHFRCDTVHLERATTYQPTEAQCDSDPLTTADGSKINPNDYQRWVAMSWDIIWDVERQGLYSDTTFWRGKFEFGDTIQIYSKKFPHLNGDWYLHDVMSSEYRMSIDFLLEPEKNYPKLGVGTDCKIIWCP